MGLTAQPTPPNNGQTISDNAELKYFKVWSGGFDTSCINALQRRILLLLSQPIYPTSDKVECFVTFVKRRKNRDLCAEKSKSGDSGGGVPKGKLDKDKGGEELPVSKGHLYMNDTGGGLVKNDTKPCSVDYYDNLGNEFVETVDEDHFGETKKAVRLETKVISGTSIEALISPHLFLSNI